MENIEQKVDQIFAEWDHTNTPGCSLIVIKDGKTCYSRGYGLANLDFGIPIRPDTVFHIASISKHFAALAVTLLAHEGKLSLDDEVRKYVPELTDFGAPGRAEKITIRHLLHHISGLRDQWELLVAAGWRFDDVITMDDILELVSKQRELNFKPGEKYTYCNTGFTLIAFIVQRVSGKSLREFCEERMFKPLGMRHTHFHDDHTMIVPNRATSYSPDGYNRFKISVLSYANVGATSLFTTVEDMALWDQEFYEGKIFGMDVIKEMHTQGILNSGEVLDYAYGLVISKYRGLKTVDHSGSDAGYRTQLLRFPDQHFTVVVFANLGNINVGALAHKVADLYLADQMLPAQEEKLIDLPEKTLEKFAGHYFNADTCTHFLLEMREKKLVLADDIDFELEAIGENKLRLKLMPDMKMTFVEGPQGMQMHLVRGRNPKPEILDRVVVPLLDLKVLEEYTGTYYSPELEVYYQLLIKDGKLALQRRKYGTCILKPVVKDVFSSDQFNLVFYRDQKGEIEGIMLYTMRVQGLRFLRQSQK